MMTGVEVLAELVLITWIASFTFLVMQKNLGARGRVVPLTSNNP